MTNQKRKKTILHLPEIDTKNKVYNTLEETDRAELSKPFELQVFGMPTAHVENMTLNQDDRVWLLRKDDFRDKIIRADLQQYVDDVYNKTSKLLVAQLSEVLDAHWARTNEIIDKLTGKVDKISSDIQEMKGNFEKRIKALEEAAKYHDKLDKKDADLEKMIRVLAECGKLELPWYRKPFWVIISRVIEFVILGGAIWYLHNRFWK